MVSRPSAWHFTRRVSGPPLNSLQGLPLMPLSELELHEITHESLLAAIRDLPIRPLDLCKDSGTRDRIARPGIGVPGRVAAVNGRYEGHRSRGRRGVLRDASVVFFCSLYGSAHERAQHRSNPVWIRLAQSPRHLRTTAERVATALHLPAVHPDRHDHEPDSDRSQETRRTFSFLVCGLRWRCNTHMPRRVCMILAGSVGPAWRPCLSRTTECDGWSLR